MTDQQQHLQQVLEQQKTLVGEINELNTQVDSKRQMALKLQGVLEYLQQLGVELPKGEEASTEEGEAPSKIKDNRFGFYCMLGSRYMIYENIGFNVSIKAHLTNQDTQVNETSASGGSSSGTQIELNLLSLSVFL